MHRSKIPHQYFHLPSRNNNPEKMGEAKEEEKKPLILYLRQPHPPLEQTLSLKFQILKPPSPTTPIPQFLSTHQYPSSSIRAILCSGYIPIDAPIITSLPNLACVVTTSAGLNHIDLAECRRRGVVVANAGGVFSVDVADYAVGLLIDVLRRISASNRYVRSGRWGREGRGEEYFPLGSKLGGKKVGLVGLGNIGSEIAKRLEAFGCIISYNSRRRKPGVSYSYYPNICDLASDSDVLVVACPLTDETRHIINKDVLSALGKNSIVINIGRGALVDEKELVRCLTQGEIGGAGLDVFENEPSAPKELFLMENVVLSPHHAVCTPESFRDLFYLCIANLEAFFAGQPLLTPVKCD
ncbi:Glyoxylate/hydroxypyruvate reductase HPR3 [Acorus calamus]|uniref:Glyoxylate/hydroxypyruvate reductase HPR3 n=1 Tax=Acorus calamus TaxID=4465 RepID=A0AAV9EW88_ACOCL|nr:Glyoxylate/hydroxypyruvate reductase HPR3 [Acorus calamus]